MFPGKVEAIKNRKKFDQQKTIIAITIFSYWFGRETQDHEPQLNAVFRQTIPRVSKDRRRTGRFRTSIRTCPPTVYDSTLPVKLTSAPTAPYLVRFSDPIFPTTTRPVLTAMPISSSVILSKTENPGKSSMFWTGLPDRWIIFPADMNKLAEITAGISTNPGGWEKRQMLMIPFHLSCKMMCFPKSFCRTGHDWLKKIWAGSLNLAKMSLWY